MLAAVSVRMSRFVSRWAARAPWAGTNGRSSVDRVLGADELERDDLRHHLVGRQAGPVLAPDDRS